MNWEQTEVILKVIGYAAVAVTSVMGWLNTRRTSHQLKKATVERNVNQAQAEERHLETTCQMEELSKSVAITKDHINSRMDQMMAVVAKEQRALGFKEGVESKRDQE